ncbi:MAG: hypothetical protein Q4E74_02030 [Ruminococcus sp.]|nr:hypothetical protein [Ruminococcus sp.]
MLSKILSKEECAKCRLCCSFDSYDLWETPVITTNMASRILQEYLPQQEFIRRDGHFLLKMEKEPDDDLYYCSLLDRDKGCILGSDKPFDCRIWPFRVMSLGITRVITLSPVCPVVQTKPLKEIQALAKELAPEIFEYADENPDAVKPYIDGYPIMVVEKPDREDSLV